MSHGDALRLTSTSPRQTGHIGRCVGRSCRAGDCIALVGELGAGKTQFVRGLTEGLGGDPRQVSSPTFVLMQEYATRPPDPPLIHIDAYRMQSLDELETLGWSADVTDESITVIEWADRIAPELPDDRLELQLTHEGDDQRQIELHAHGKWWQRIGDLAESLAAAGIECDAATPEPGPCPICRTSVDADAKHFPFCSQRCRMVDLGRWMGGHYRSSRPIDWSSDDLSEAETE